MEADVGSAVVGGVGGKVALTVCWPLLAVSQKLVCNGPESLTTWTARCAGPQLRWRQSNQLMVVIRQFWDKLMIVDSSVGKVLAGAPLTLQRRWWLGLVGERGAVLGGDLAGGLGSSGAARPGGGYIHVD